MSLIHIQSVGSQDSLHFIWSFIGSPSVLMVRTPLDSALKVNWDEFFSGNELAIYFEGSKPLYEFGWSLTKVPNNGAFAWMHILDEMQLFGRFSKLHNHCCLKTVKKIEWIPSTTCDSCEPRLPKSPLHDKGEINMGEINYGEPKNEKKHHNLLSVKRGFAIDPECVIYCGC